MDKQAALDELDQLDQLDAQDAGQNPKHRARARAESAARVKVAQQDWDEEDNPTLRERLEGAGQGAVEALDVLHLRPQGRGLVAGIAALMKDGDPSKAFDAGVQGELDAERVTSDRTPGTKLAGSLAASAIPFTGALKGVGVIEAGARNAGLAGVSTLAHGGSAKDVALNTLLGGLLPAGLGIAAREVPAAARAASGAVRAGAGKASDVVRAGADKVISTAEKPGVQVARAALALPTAGKLEGGLLAMKGIRRLMGEKAKAPSSALEELGARGPAPDYASTLGVADDVHDLAHEAMVRRTAATKSPVPQVDPEVAAVADARTPAKLPSYVNDAVDEAGMTPDLQSPAQINPNVARARAQASEHLKGPSKGSLQQLVPQTSSKYGPGPTPEQAAALLEQFPLEQQQAFLDGIAREGPQGPQYAAEVAGFLGISP